MHVSISSQSVVYNALQYLELRTAGAGGDIPPSPLSLRLCSSTSSCCSSSLARFRSSMSDWCTYILQPVLRRHNDNETHCRLIKSSILVILYMSD